jgi:hypothetical protein
MIAADRMMREGMSVIVGGTKAQRDARNSRYRLDDPDELRGPEDAAEAPKSRRKIGDADSGALPIRENRRYDSGIAEIFGFEFGHVMEHDVRKSLLLVTCEQAAEDRIAVEARIAPPHQSRSWTDERGGASIADDGKVKPMIRHEIAISSLRDIRSSQ